METRANYVAAGIFTLLALLAAFVIVWWFSTYRDGDTLVPIDIRIQGSVSGLGPGSAVQFNGIDVGRVEKVGFDKRNPRFVLVRARVNSELPLREDTRASIGTRGISGGAFIALEGGTLDAPAVLSETEGGPVPQIDGDPSAVTDLIQRVNQLANRAEEVVVAVESLVKQNSETVTRTIENAETFSQALATNSGGVEKFLKSAGDVAVSLEGLSQKLDGTITAVEAIVQAVEPDAVRESVENAREFTRTLANQRETVATALVSINRVAENLQSFTGKLETTLGSVDGIVAAVEPDRVRSTLQSIDEAAKRANEITAAIDAGKLGQAVDDLSATASSARGILEGVDQDAVKQLVADMGAASKNVTTILAALDATRINTAVDNIANAAEGAQKIVTDVSKVTERFGNRGDDIDKIVDEAVALSANLNAASKRIDGVIDRVDGLLGSGQADGLFAEVRTTLAQFRKTAQNFDSQISGVAAGINRFTGRGLGDTQTLIRDARQSLRRIDRVIRNLESNPSALISGSGGSQVRETRTGRPRR